MKFFKRLALFFVLIFGVWFLAAISIPLPKRLDTPSSLMIGYRDGTPAHVFLAPDDRWRIRAQLDEIDPRYIEGLLAVEDRRYWHHFGVDPISIVRALLQNQSSGRVVSGASTITMQLVRVLEPRPRNLFSKAIEAFRATQLEHRLSKEEILEAYLSFIPFGRNIEGVEAASLHYFGHRPHQLELHEIATLIAVPQSPSARYPNAHNKNRVLSARTHIADLLLSKGVHFLSKGESLERAVGEKEFPKRSPFPREIPHLAYWIRSRTHEERIQTTLERSLQTQLEDEVARVRSQLGSKKIFSVSVTLADTQTGSVVAMVGGFDYWSSKEGAQIASFFSKRSSGSTLKPVLFAMSIEDGLFLEEQLIRDVPLRFRDYEPRNYNGSYDGLVPLNQALSRSLNIPFIHILSKLGLGDFVHKLKEMGVESIEQERERLGLSAALGVYLKPLELHGIYNTLANKGRHVPLHFTDTKMFSKEGESKRIFREGSAWLTQKALRIQDRPDVPSHRNLSYNAPQVAWKTGTSYGNHDAWAAGWSGKYSAVVWLGNLDYTSSEYLVGSTAAAPLLFDVFDRVSEKAPLEQIPKELRPVQVCSFSGQLAQDACPAKKDVLALVDRIPPQLCSYHIHAELDSTGRWVLPECRNGRKTQKTSLLRLPSLVHRWYQGKQGALPKLAEGCEGFNPIPIEGGRVQIVSPKEGRIFVLIEGIPLERQKIAMQAIHANPNQELYWYVDGVYKETTKATKDFWWIPISGKHEIEVRTADGSLDSVSVVVDQHP